MPIRATRPAMLGLGVRPNRSTLERLADRSRVPVAWRVPILVYVWCQIVLLAWWAGQYPALLSTDSVTYVRHVTSGPWTADHSVVYDSLVLLSLTITSKLALLSLVQTICAACIFAYSARTVQLYGVRGRWAVLGALIAPLFPSIGGFVPMIWKDVPFTFACVMAVATTLRVLIHRRERPGIRLPHRHLIALTVEFTALTLFRNNGFVVLVIAALLLVIAFPGLRLRLVACTAIALALFGICEAVIYPAAGIKPASSTLAYGTFYADVAVVYSEAPHSFSTSDLALMKQVMPLKDWRAASNCYDSDPLFRPPFDRQAAARLKNQLAELWIRVATRSPIATAKAHLCRAAVGWDPFPPPLSRSAVHDLPHKVPAKLYTDHPGIPLDVAKQLQSHPLSGKLYHLTYDLRAASYQHVWVQVLFFEGSLWSYLLYIALGIGARRQRDRALLSVGAISLATQLSVIAANPAQLFRYMIGPIVIGVLFVPLASVVRRTRGATTAPDSTAPVADEPVVSGTI